MLLTMYEVFRLPNFVNSHKHILYIVPEACFHAESIGASPVIIAGKTAKLFKFLQVYSPHERTMLLILDFTLVNSLGQLSLDISLEKVPTSNT